ncbi:hypothetical protein QBC36DRAFT_389979 [Triangularia setosa]|uniref:HNH nuclease domain-containing protein n=1 Tax=Triangularia setosa TaxID=2587417 RepID=A0AAN7A2M2_9PEZI|nr:hypothetical protein QBC36DRAFT_389979 [Podospora setosa]
MDLGNPRPISEAHVVDFLHPGYLGSAAVLLSLPALDLGGIDFDTALAACGLIAGNRWSDGFFSLDRDGAVSVERPDNGILREPQYFFHLPSPLDPPYPIVPRDVARRCVLSNYGDGLEMAHLLPAGEDDWWLSNQMQQYSPTQLFSRNPIDGPANLLTLQANLHRVFDERHFCFVPKVREKNKPPQLVLHVFNSTPSGHLPNLWHNRAVHPIPTTVAVECLFARVAWTILSPCVFDMFLPSTFETEEVSPEMCRQMWKNARSRSPRKRSPPRSDDAADEILAMESPSPHDSGYFGRDTLENDGCYNDEFGYAKQYEGERLGRLRKRKCSSEELGDVESSSATAV